MGWGRGAAAKKQGQLFKSSSAMPGKPKPSAGVDSYMQRTEQLRIANERVGKSKARGLTPTGRCGAGCLFSLVFWSDSGRPERGG